MKTVAERFWPKVTKAGPDDCWPWNAGRDDKGYGTLSTRHGKSPVKAHRVSWELHNGPIPPGKEVMHDCDNPPCVNPRHLKLGTHQQNMADAHKRGRINNYRHGRGENNNAAKLTADQVREVRLFAGKLTQTALAKEFKVSRRTIFNILNRKQWN